MRDLILSFASKAYMLTSRQPRVTVVAIHRVGHSSRIQPSHILRCFKFLAKHFRVVLPHELNLAKTQGRVAVVTIDDGHADAYKSIFPIAKTTGIRLSLCISTDFFFRREWLWFDKIDWAMQHAKHTAKAIVNGLEVYSEDPSSFMRLKQHLKQLLPSPRSLAIHDLLCSLHLNLPESPPNEYRALTTSELREMLSSGLIEIVGHSVTHTIATVLDDYDLDTELTQAKHQWESFLGQPIVSFCYPNGQPGDFNKRTSLALQRAGYRYAFTSIEGTNLIKTMDRFEMKRVDINERLGVFAKLVSGLADLQNILCNSSYL